MREMSRDSFPFPVYSGLLEPRHYKKIGSAIWLFLWCINATTAEQERDGVVWGIVLGNKPIKTSDLEPIFGVTERTIRSWIKLLEDHGYIRVTRAPYGLIFTVKNSKKKRKLMDEPEENFRSPPVTPEENFRSEPGDRKETSDLPEENFRSNKDFVVDLKDVDVVVDIEKEVEKIEQCFLRCRGKGLAVSPTDYDEIRRLVANGVPSQLAITCIEQSFREYKPKYERDEIRSVSYCIPLVYSEWERYKQRQRAITGAVPHVPVTLGSGNTSAGYKSKQQRELDDLERLREEELRREQTPSH
jgi:hypothetical protein